MLAAPYMAENSTFATTPSSGASGNEWALGREWGADGAQRGISDGANYMQSLSRPSLGASNAASTRDFPRVFNPNSSLPSHTSPPTSAYATHLGLATHPGSGRFGQAGSCEFDHPGREFVYDAESYIGRSAYTRNTNGSDYAYDRNIGQSDYAYDRNPTRDAYACSTSHTPPTSTMPATRGGDFDEAQVPILPASFIFSSNSHS